MRAASPPSSVTIPPPSSTVSTSVRSSSVCAIAIVAGALPHENVILPPAAIAVARAACVHDSGVPVPTT